MGKIKSPDLQTKTISSFNPFDKFDTRIIDFMCKISKNIYNSAIYCHQIYDIFYVDIYSDLIVFINKNYNELSTARTEVRKEIIHDLLIKIFNTYHSFHCKNLDIIKNINSFIWKTVCEINKNTPLINLNFETILNEVFKVVTKETQKYSVICHKFFNLLQRKVFDAVSWIYNENYNKTKSEMLLKKKCTINNKEFINDIKSGKASNIVILNRSFYKEKVGKILKIDMKSDQFIIKKFTVNNLGDNSNLLPSDIITNIIDKTYDAYKSFLVLKEKGIKCERQSFLPKNGRFNLFYTNSSRKIVKIRGKLYVRLNVGQYISNNYLEITKNTKMKQIENKTINKKYVNENNKNHIIDGNYIYLKLPKKLKSTGIQLLNIVPVHNGLKYKVCYVYDIKKKINDNYDKTNLEHYLFADTGIVNLFTLNDPTGSKQYIISGNQINSLNFYYNNKIDSAKSELKMVNNKHMSRKISNLFIKKEHKINDYFNKVCKWLVETYPNKKCVVVGYNPNWKNKVKIGNVNNRKFYEIPYAKLLSKLKNKLESLGMELKLTEESYTSKCDGLALEEINKKEKYLGKRIRRGLFSSSTKQLINADINGAINIGRKYMKKMGVVINKINRKGIYNPIKIRNL